MLVSKHGGAIYPKSKKYQTQEILNFLQKDWLRTENYQVYLCVVWATCVMLTQHDGAHIDDNVDFFFSFLHFFDGFPEEITTWTFSYLY